MDASGAVAKVPIFVGRWREDPRVTLLSSAAAQYQLDAEDNGAGINFSPGTYGQGPAAGDGQTRPVLPGFPNFAEEQAAGNAVLPITWAEHKPSLTSQSAFYAQPASRPYAFNFTLGSQVAARAWLGFWADRQGPAGLLWLPSFSTEGAGLLAAAPAGAMAVSVDLKGLSDLVNRGLALFSAPVLEVVKVTSIAGTTANLAQPLNNGWAPPDALAGIASLARFSGNELRLSWLTPDTATCSASFVESPWEYTVQAGETAATQGTIGALVHLYTFERWTRAGLQERRRYTDAAEGAFISGAAYLASSFTHQDVTQSLNLEDDQLTVKVRSFSGDPLTELISGVTPPDSIWRLEIAESIAAGAPRILFYGELTGIRGDGPWIEGTCVRLGGLPERKFPSALVQTTCNYAVFSRACGLVSTSWQWSGNVAAVSGVVVTVGGLSGPGGFVGTAFPGFFVGGLFVSQLQSARIVADSISGSNRLVTLERALTLAVGPVEGLQMIPGCDGQQTTCRAYNAGANPTGKFDNFTRFGGFPWLPLANPTTAAVRAPAPAFGKK
jgi:hypothetical protein